MKKAWIASLLALLLSLPVAAAAAVPQTLNFSARIADNGRPVTGSHTVKFAFWDCDGSDPLTCVDPANVLWSETQTLTVSDGVVSAVLGADTTTPNPLPIGIFNGAPLFLEVTFDGTAFSPRMTLHSVPYALSTGSVRQATTVGPSQALFATLASGSNHILGSAFTPPRNGTCIVTNSLTIFTGAANTSTGPFFRIAVERGGVAGDDGQYGLYPGPIPGGARASMARTRMIPVNAGQPTAFGCGVLGVPADWVGDSAECVVDAMCFY